MLEDKGLTRPEEIKTFLEGLGKVSVKVSKEERYAWIAGTLKRTGYMTLSKKERGIIFEYLQFMTGLCRQQLSKLLQSYRKEKWIGKKGYVRHRFSSTYTRADILLLAQTDEYHQTLSGPATKKLFERGLYVDEDKAYERLAGISVAHIYNLRRSIPYINKRQVIKKTQRSEVKLGERRKPQPNGEPGYIRIDTVHQGDLDGRKGVYHINAVDCIFHSNRTVIPV